MAEATVTQESGTVQTEETKTEQTSQTQETKVEEVKKPTLAETERLYRENFDKGRGRDVTKLVGYKAPEVKTEEKKEEVKTEDKKVEDKKADEKVETTPPKPKTGAGRMKFKLALTKQENESLKQRLADLEFAVKNGITKPTEQKKEETLEEPKRESFATDLEYFAAVRAFDKEVAKREREQEQQSRVTETQKTEAARRYNTFIDKLADVKKTHADWDEVSAKATVEFNPILEGVIFSADPEFLYYSATHQRAVKNLNDMGEIAVVAVGNGDNITGLLQYLSENPDEIDKLNVLNPVKAQTYVGKLEARIEAGLQNQKKDDKVESRTSSGTDDKAKKPVTAATEEGKTGKEETKVEPPPRVRPEPPAKLPAGQAPSHLAFTDPAHMTLAERERLYREDPRYGRKH